MREWLVEIRNRRGLSQLDVANKCDISRAYYTQIERSNRNPSVKVAKKIGNILEFEWIIFFN